VTHQPLAIFFLAIFFVKKMHVPGSARGHFCLNRRSQQFPGTCPDHFGQRIWRKFRWQIERYNSKFGVDLAMAAYPFLFKD